MFFLVFPFSSCNSIWSSPSGSSSRIVTASPSDGDYRRCMREFIEKISDYARTTTNTDNTENSSFIIIPQNGQAVAWSSTVATEMTVPSQAPDQKYMQAVSGIGREDMFYGYSGDGIVTEDSVSTYFRNICTLYQKQGKTVLSVDYCSSTAGIADSYEKNTAAGFIGFAAPDRNLAIVPDSSGYDAAYYPYNVNSSDVSSLSAAKNFIYLLNSENFSDPDNSIPGSTFVSTLAKTNYDIIIMDAFTDSGTFLYTAEQIKTLKKKANGGTRLVIAYMSIGEAESYRWYWKSDWTDSSGISNAAPAWLDAENPDWNGNYKVRYWDSDWQSVIYGNDSSYVKKILDAGFDGVYLDIVDAYEYYEAQ